MNLNGNCGEIARFHYSNKAVRDNHLERLITIAGFNGYFGNRIKEWHGGAAQFCAATGMNIYDLFYWEQRMSNWGALYPFEQDIAIESSPRQPQESALCTAADRGRAAQGTRLPVHQGTDVDHVAGNAVGAVQPDSGLEARI